MDEKGKTGSSEAAGGSSGRGTKSIVGVFSMIIGKVMTKQAIGSKVWPMWDGEGEVKKARWIGMETLEVLRTRDF